MPKKISPIKPDFSNIGEKIKTNRRLSAIKGAVFFNLKKIIGGWRWPLQNIIPAAMVVLIICLITAALACAYQFYYADKFFPGTKLANINLSGQTIAGARQKLIHKIDSFSQQGLTLTYQNKTLDLLTSFAASPDSAIDLFYFKPEDSLRALYAVGRTRYAPADIWQRLKVLILSPDYSIKFYLDENRLRKILQMNFGDFEQPARDAAIVFHNSQPVIEPESYGKIFDYPAIAGQIKTRLAGLDAKPVQLALRTDYPSVYARDLDANILNQAVKSLDIAPLKLIVPADSKIAAGKYWLIQKSLLAEWLTAFKNNQQQIAVNIKPGEAAQYLEKNIAPAVNIEPTDAKFKITDGKVSEFLTSRKGQRLNIAETLNRINLTLQTAGQNISAETIINLPIEEIDSDINNENANNLGIKEILGTGQSNFAGSPANRKHNIAVGAAAVNGILIRPGEEFSLLKTLGVVDASSGYLPELVIKGDKTTPEYGGGLCQIGTTVFRSALASGLPITERHNHSYRVSYYEPAGTDATIYDPAPDLKFINDTGNYVLIQSRINGDNLYFDFWGTKDGRIAEQTKPKIFNITPPPSSKIIETDLLPPGEKKCTERAHSGADAVFNYKIAYPDNTTKEQTFSSHYRPWQEVCLVGVAATSTPAALNNDSSSPIAPENNGGQN